MLFEEDVLTAILRRRYKGLRGIKHLTLHHLRPSSRGGGSNQFNLFPWDASCHAAYHKIFLNMTIHEVWEALDDIYRAVFLNGEEFVQPFWLRVCELKQKKNVVLSKRFATAYLQEAWQAAFGSRSLGAARWQLRLMMTFMVFGQNMSDTSEIFEDTLELEEYFERIPQSGDRTRSLRICFGPDPSVRAIKNKLARIIAKNGHSL